MAGFIYFTEEQKRRANEVNLESFLLRQGERLLKSGREKRLASDHSITVREMRRAFAYLTTTRGISRTVLAEFIKRRMIYEDRKYHNAVFVGYDKSGVARHAHKHGTFTGGEGI